MFSRTFKTTVSYQINKYTKLTSIYHQSFELLFFCLFFVGIMLERALQAKCCTEKHVIFTDISPVHITGFLLLHTGHSKGIQTPGKNAQIKK